MKQGLVGVLTTGSVLILGLLSFSGMLAVSPSLALAATSMGVAVLIEGEVYKQNIAQGLKRLFQPGLSRKRLEMRFKKDPSKVAVRLWFIHASWVIALAAGVTAVLVSLSEMTAALSFIGVTVSSLAFGAGLVPIAVLGGLGYAVMIHHTLAAMIEDDRVARAYRFLKKQMRRKVDTTTGLQEGVTGYALRLLGYGTLAGVVTTLGIFMTVATAGTWWGIVNNLPVQLGFIGLWLGRVTLPLFVLSQFAFGILNAMQSSIALLKLKWDQSNLKARFSHHFFPETFTSSNPFLFVARFIELPFRAVVFLAHMVSVGVTADRAFGLTPWITAVFNSVNDGLTDLHYFMPHEDEDECGHHHSDLPGVCLKVLFTLVPLYPLALLYEACVSSHFSMRQWKDQAAQIYGSHAGHDHFTHKDPDEPAMHACEMRTSNFVGSVGEGHQSTLSYEAEKTPPASGLVIA